jgi:tRNA-splicing ligase RtcB
MGAKSFIVRGKGNPRELHELQPRRRPRDEPYQGQEAVHGGRPDQAATEGVECRKDADVIDEIPMAYKDIDAVMEAQSDLVEVVYTLKQVVCVKG